MGPGGHRIVFEGVTPDDDPMLGMVIMKGFIFYGDDGTSDKPPPVKSSSSNGGSGGRENKSSRAENGTITHLPGNNRDSILNIKPALKGSIHTISKSIPDININSQLNGYGGNESMDENDNTAASPYSTINYNTMNSRYNRNLNQFSNSNQLTVTSIKSVSICEDNNSVYDTITSSYPHTSYSTRLNRQERRRSSRVSIISSSSLKKVRRASLEFLEKITPIDKSGWKHRNWGGRSLEVIKAPIRFFLLLTTPTVDVDPHATPSEEEDEVDRVEWNKPLSILHCITGPIFVIFATGYGLVWVGPIPLAVIVFIVAAAVSCLMVFTSKFETPPSYYKTYCSYLGFIVGVVWVYFISTEVVSNIRALGVVFNLSEATIGMTMLALGNCLLDFISNVSIAKKGYPRMALAACLGSPLLALLLGVGIPATFRTASNLNQAGIHLNPTTLLVVIYIAIVSSLSLTVIVCGVFKWEAKTWWGYILIALYFIVIAVVFLVEFEVIPVSFPTLRL